MADISFPQDVVWVFNPNFVEIERVTEHADDIQVVVGAKSINVSVYNGSASVNISGLLQNTFLDPQTERGKQIYVLVVIGGETVAQKAIFAVWGAIGLGDRFAQFGAFDYDPSHGWLVRKVQWFVNYPFSLNLLMTPGKYRVRQDSGGYQADVVVPNASLLNYDLTTRQNVQREFVIRQDPEGAKDTGTFDETFDYTFHLPSDIVTITRAIVRKETEGVYLRWIDRFGFLQYYLFSTGEKNLKTSPSSDSLTRVAAREGMSFATANRPVSVTTGRSQKACAVSLDAETLDYVSGIIASPIVDMYLGKSKSGAELWQPVSIEGGTYKYSTHHNASLQDFEITITLPDLITQSL